MKTNFTVLVAGSIVGHFFAYLGAAIFGAITGNQAKTCSTLHDDIDTLKSIITSQAVMIANMQSITIKLQQKDAGDEVASLSMTTITCGQKTGNPVTCGVPAGFCPA